MTKRLASAALALALTLGAPGLPAYQAAAQMVRAPAITAPVAQAAGWGQALGRLTANLERDPGLIAGSSGLLRILGRAGRSCLGKGVLGPQGPRGPGGPAPDPDPFQPRPGSGLLPGCGYHRLGRPENPQAHGFRPGPGPPE